jgi:hypothetical protein
MSEKFNIFFLFNRESRNIKKSGLKSTIEQALCISDKKKKLSKLQRHNLMTLI